MTGAVTVGRAPETVSAITGIGMSEVARPSARSPLDLTIDACLEAIADAGLTRDDIDGLSTYPGFLPDDPGLGSVGVHEMQAALGLKLDWLAGGHETSGQLGAVFNAVAALAAGLATHVLVFRTVAEASTRIAGRARADDDRDAAIRVGGIHQWTAPFNALPPAPRFALLAQRHFHEYGTTEDQLAQIALNARRNAMRNPRAIYRTPLTLEDYRRSRRIATPLRLYDCDVPVDGAVALIVSRREPARDGPNPVLRVQAIGTALRRPESWFRPESLTESSASDAAAMMWRRSGLTPRDVDVAQLYDGFSIFALLWLEALGLCGRGESGPFVEGGRRIALDGELPLNTDGGQLSAGRLHGLGFLHEACVQLWRRGGERQVASAPRVAVVAAGYSGGFNGCMLLVRDD